MKDVSKCSNLRERESAQNISMDSCNTDDIQKHPAALHVLVFFLNKMFAMFLYVSGWYWPTNV